ncbi:MAG: His Kinase A (Phospho-acceptor) domain-containing protein [uncultured Thiotrichaceae bacterium]|uniref:histidine kinase n=1 Tax=uncultured Thiotrichaceae bacterium TaxID=298394 RepID=A0A6S6TU14_9GAMM|nr:MAG: His Kinase A (Phospho-acceptor) domain-containing protein [uncultured Thiotrichaceae bacterium]
MKHWRHIVFFLIGTVFSLYPPIAQSADNSVITLTDESSNIQINDWLEFTEDKNKQLTIEQLIAPSKAIDEQFRSNVHRINMQEQFWLRFRIQNKGHLDYYLTLAENTLLDIRIYQLSIPSQKKQLNSASITPKTILPMSPQILPTYPLHIPKDGKIHTYYLRLSHSTKTIPTIHIQTSGQLLNNSNAYIFFYALIIGAMLIVSIYNLILFISLREAIYASLAISIFSQTFLLADINGLYQFLIHAENITNLTLFNTMYLLAIISALDFLRRVMDAKNYAPFINKLFLGIIFTLSFTLLFIPYLDKAGQLIHYFVIAVMPISFISVVWVKLKGRRFATSLILVVPVYLITVTPFLLSLLGTLDNTNLYMKLMHIGLLIASISFSLTLAEKTQEIQESSRLAQTANEAKGKFIANMSHELRTPMNATIGISQLLKQTPLSDQQKNYVDKLLTSSQHMMQLINKLLDFSKTQAGKLTLTPHDFSLKNMLNTVCIQVEDACNHKDIEFNLTIDPQCPLYFTADQTALGQVLINLSNNAVKFTNKGNVTLNVQLLEQKENRALLSFHVADTGLGMTMQEQQRIFEPFSMGNMEYSRKQGGTGLGLTISKDLLKLMGSHIEVSSTPNIGSVFSFSLWLPISEESSFRDEVQKTIPPLSSHPQLLGKHVMVVDDDPLNRMVAKELLNVLGLEVSLVESGNFILSRLANKAPELIFLDLQMPELDGYATMELLKEDGRFQHIPVVALTAHASSEDENRCMQAGMISFITKPIDLNEVQHLLLSQLAPSKEETSSTPF